MQRLCFVLVALWLTTIGAEQNRPPKGRRVNVQGKNSGQKTGIAQSDGALLTAQELEQAGHHGRFDPESNAAGELAQTDQLYSIMARPGLTTRAARRPLTQTTTPGWLSPQRRTSHSISKRSFTQENTAKSVYNRPFPSNPFLSDSRNPFPQNPSNPFLSGPSNPFPGRVTNPFLNGNIPDIEGQPSNPVTIRPPVTIPRPNTALPQAITDPPSGPAAIGGLVVAACPESADELICVKEQLCDLNTGYLVGEGYRLSPHFSKDLPALGMVQCLLDNGRLDVCCRRPPHLSTSTTLPFGIDYLEGLSTTWPQHRQQKPSNIFLPSFE